MIGRVESPGLDVVEQRLMYRWAWHCPLLIVRELFITAPIGSLSTTPAVCADD